MCCLPCFLAGKDCESVGSLPAPGAEDSTGKRSGRLAVVQHHLAADDDVVHAFRALHPPGRPGGPVV